MVLLNIDTCDVILRKSVYSFRKRVYDSDNVLIKTLVDSVFFHASDFVKHWHKVVFLRVIE